MISSLKIKIGAENFGGIGKCLWCCWKDLDDQGFNGIYLVRFGFKMWEILIFIKYIIFLEFYFSCEKLTIIIKKVAKMFYQKIGKKK